MFKKTSMKVVLVLAMLISVFSFTDSTSGQANDPACRNLAECREREQETRESIAGMLEEEGELSGEIAILQAEISRYRTDIAELESEIGIIEFNLENIRLHIIEIADEIYENIELLEQTEREIEILLDEISARMRIAQRANHRNSFLVMITEADSFMDLIRYARTFSRMAEDDAESMENLARLIDQQEHLLLVLEEQHETAQARRDQHETGLAILENERSNLRVLQLALIEQEAVMQDQLYRLYEDILNEERILADLEEAQEILRRTPPPPVITHATPGMPQTPNASGLAHPMPGAIVTDEFGTRGGGHRGIDLVVPGNTSAPILAAAHGVVIANAWEGGFGHYIIISHNINGERVDTLYAHFRYASPLGVGTVVSQGDFVGTKGSTGISSGPHLHFEVHPGGITWGRGRGVNPRLWINF